jgi:membrane fusion protein (multidrug efflux system)
VITANTRTVPIVYDFAAQVAGSREVEIRARVSGIIRKRNFVEGQSVQAGQSLFLLDPDPYKVARERAAAEKQAAQARLIQAQRQAKRMQEMIRSQSAARRDFDDAESALAVAAADLKAAEARLDESELNLRYTRVESPVSGIASREQRSEGSYVRGPEDLLTTVTQIDPAYIQFGIPDREALRVRRAVDEGRMRIPDGLRFRAQILLADGRPHRAEGRLTFNDVRVNPTTGTSEARVVVENSEGLLQPGQFVRIRLLDAERIDAIVVPQRAVLDGPQGKMLLAVDAAEQVQPKPVTVGEWVDLPDGAGWVIDQGLAPGERVIVDGIFHAKPGGKVKAIPMGSRPETQAQQGQS